MATFRDRRGRLTNRILVIKISLSFQKKEMETFALNCTVVVNLFSLMFALV